MKHSLFRVSAVVAAAALVVAACGADDTASQPTAPADPDLRPPVVVDVGAAGSPATAAGELAVSDAGGRSAEDAVDAPHELSIMPVFGGFVYEVGDGLGDLPTNDTGYEIPADADIDAERVAALATALGVDGEPVRGTGRDGDGVLWRVGPDDGTAPTVAVLADGQLSWYYSPAWGQSPAAVPCEMVMSDSGAAGDAAGSDAAGESDAAGSDGAGESGDSAAGDSAVVDVCPEPEPPAGVPDQNEAEQRAIEVLGALGRSAESFELDTYADEWSASVTAWELRDGIRWPMSWGFGFGEQGALQWAGGTFAEPIPAGPYPLVDLDTAIERLNEQGAWWGVSVAATSELIRASDPGEPTTDGDTAVSSGDTPAEAPVDGEPEPAVELVIRPAPAEAPVDGEPDSANGPAVEPGVQPEPVIEPEVAVLVEVRADLWWVWDTDGLAWLLPAYTFVDTDGRSHTVPAVTDEFVTFADPLPIDTAPAEPGQPEPLPVEPVDPVEVDVLPDEGDGTDGHEGGQTGTVDSETPGLPDPVDLDALDRDALIGATVDEATALLEADGITLRVIQRDGEHLPATMDYRPNRVNVAVADDAVVELLSVG